MIPDENLFHSKRGSTMANDLNSLHALEEQVLLLFPTRCLLATVMHNISRAKRIFL